MPLSLSTTSGSQKSIEGYMGDSIFIDEAEVIEVINRSGSKKSANQGWVNDLQIEVKFRLLKNDWERTFNMGGNFRKELVKEKDKEGNTITKEVVTDWGGTFKVRGFFEACNALQEDAIGGKEELQATLEAMETGEINPICIEKAKGSTVKLLSYRKADGKSKSWNQVAHVKRDNQKWKDYFLSQVDKEYVRDYVPDAKSATSNSTSSKANGALDMTWENEDSESKLDEF